MTTATADRSARKPPRVKCPHCTYSAEPGSSIAGHVAMSHPDVPMDVAAPKRQVSAGGKAVLDALAASTEEPDEYGHVGVIVQLPIAKGQLPAFEESAASTGTIAELPLDLVDVGHNVRINVAELEELAASIREHGVLQPIKATGPHADGRYLVTWGQRRTLASRMAERTTIPAIVLPPTADVDADGAARSIEQLVENLHRADLNPIDRAQAMRAVVDSGVTQADLARKLGIAPSTVANDLRILNLDAGVVERIREGALSASHGKSIASLPPKQQREIAERVVRDKVSTKDLERELEWKRAEAANEEARAKRTEKALPKLTAAVAAAGLAPGTTVYLMQHYNFDHQALQKALTDAGFAELKRGYAWPRPDKGQCDCTVVRIEFERAWKVTPACADDRHRDRERNFVRVETDEERQAIAAKAAVLRAQIRPLLDDVPLPVLVLAYGDTWTIADLVAKAAQPEYDVDGLRDALADSLAGRLDASRVYNERFTALAAALETLLAMVPEASS